MPTDRHGQSPLTDDDLLEAVADELLPPVPPPPPEPDLVPPHIRAAFQMQARTVPIGEWLTPEEAQRVLSMANDWKQRREMPPERRSVFSLQLDLGPGDTTPCMEKRWRAFSGAPYFVLHVSRQIPSGYFVCVLRNGSVVVYPPGMVEASGSPEVFFANVDVIQWWRVP